MQMYISLRYRQGQSVAPDQVNDNLFAILAMRCLKGTDVSGMLSGKDARLMC